MKIITKDNFKEEIASGVVVVDMFADWCGPCRALGPILEELSEKITDVSFAKLDVDAAPEIVEEFGIQGIPCVIFFKEGKEVSRIAGLFPKQSYVDEIEKVKVA